MKNKIGELKSLWVQRDKKIIDWYALRRLKDTLETKNYESVALNDPKNMVRLAVYLLSALPLKHRLPSGEDENEQVANAVVERGLSSIWREIDMEYRQKGKKSWRWQVADMLVMTGWYAIAVDVQEGEKGRPKFIAEAWNPARVYPSFTDEGLQAVYYEYAMSRQAVENKAKAFGWNLSSVKTGALRPNVTVGLLWEMKDGVAVQTSYVGGVVVNTVETEKKAIPVFVGAVGGEAMWGGYGESDANWAQYFGESILASNEALFAAQNRWWTYLMQLVREAAKPTVLHKGGQPGAITEKKLEEIVDLAPNEDLGRMPPNQVPAHITAIAQILQEKIQQGGFNWALFGSSGPLNLSGIAISQLLTSAFAIVGEHHDTMQQLIANIDMQWLEQYKDSKFKSFAIITKKPGMVGLVKEEFKRELVSDNPFVEVTYPLATPRNKIEMLAAARQAHPVGNLLDMISTLEDILEVDDPQLILTRLQDERTRDSETVQQLQTISDMRKFANKVRTRPVHPDPQLADLIDKAWQGMLAQFGGETQAQEGAVPGVPGGGLVNNPEASGRPRSLAAQVFGQVQPNAGQEGAMPPAELPGAQGRPRGGE